MNPTVSPQIDPWEKLRLLEAQRLGPRAPEVDPFAAQLAGLEATAPAPAPAPAVSNDPWEKLRALEAQATASAPDAALASGDPWEKLRALEAQAAANAPTPAGPVTWRDDLKAGWLAARQGMVALTDVAPGAAKAGSQARLENTASDTEAVLAGNPEAASELANINAQIDALTAQIGKRGTDVNAVQAQIAALSDQRGQLQAVLGTQTSPDAIRAQGEANYAEGMADVTAGAARMQEIGKDMPPADPRAMAALDADTWGGAISAFLDNPGTVTRTALLRSLPAMAPTIGATVGGMAVGGPVGAAAAGGATGAATEFAMSLSQEVQTILQDARIDPTDEKATAAFFDANPAALDDAMKKAAIRAGIIGAADAATGGLAGKVVGATANAGRAARVGTVAAGGGIEAVGEGAGEALAMQVTEGEIKPGEVLAETLAGGAMGAPTTAGMMVAEARRNPNAANFTREGAEQVAPNTAQVTPNTAQVTQPGPEVTSGEAPAPVQPGPDVDPAVDPQTPSTPVQPQSTPTRRTRVFTPDNEEIEVDTMVVEADDLLTSDQDGYPQELQPRDRDRAASQAQIEGIANRPIPSRLDQSPETDRGSPILGPDGRVVESGNGRVMGLRRAYERGTAEEYRAYVEQNYPEAKGMKNPVIVRRRATETDAQNFAVASNAPATLALSASEQARADARLVDDDTLAAYRGGDIGSAANRDMVRGFIGRLPRTAQGALTTKDGGLTPEGYRRFQAAIFQRAYGDERLLTRLTETMDDDTKSVTTALANAAPGMARLQLEIERGAVSEGVDLSADLRAALGALADMRSRDMNLRDFRAQQDAFAEPLSPAAEAILDAFFNEAGTRMASRTAMQNFLDGYAEAAMQQRTDQADLPGVEPKPLKTAEQIATELRDAGREPAGADLFGAPVAAEDAVPALADMTDAAPDADDTTDADLLPADMEDADNTRAPRGFTPSMREASFTDRNSIYEQAFADAGVDPDEARLLPVAQQVNILTRLFKNRFGITVLRGTGREHIKGIDAVNQLLDGYRNIRFMAHVLQLPESAMSLGGDLNLKLEKFLGRYLGVYQPDAKTIGLPGRSNSFAHEWAHAMDHYLSNQLKNVDALLSQLARQKGLDPSQSAEAAFVNLIHAMFFDDAALAAKMMDLEVAASAVLTKGPDAGQPTKAALKAREQLERLRAGATRLKIDPTAYRVNSASYSPPAAGYYASVHEMLARAFEAYIAHKVELAGGTTEFIAKGDAAYLSDADRRLAMTFPKAVDRVRVFSAFDNLFDHLRRQQALGTGPAAARPSDAAIMDPIELAKQASAVSDPGATEAVAEEIRVILNTTKNLIADPKGTLRSGVSTLALNAGIAMEKGESVLDYVRRAARQSSDVSRSLYYSTRGFMKRLVARQPQESQPFLRFVLDRVMTDPGTGRAGQGVTFEEYRERTVNSAAAAITNSFKTNKLGPPGRKWINDFRLSEADQSTVWAIMTGQPAKGARPELVRFAATMRRVMNDAYSKAVSAGLQIGFVEDTGYMPRVLVNNRVHKDVEGFIADAEKLYGVVYDKLTENMAAEDAVRLGNNVARRVYPLVEPRNSPLGGLINRVRKAMKASETAAQAAMSNQTSAQAASAAAQAEADLDAAMADLFDALRDPYREKAARDWGTRVTTGGSMTFDSLGPDASFAKMRTLPPEADRIMAKWYDTDPIMGTLNYVHSTASRAAYQERFGKTGGHERLDDVLTRESVRDAIAANPGKYNPRTPKGRMNILTDLADHTTDNLMQMAFFEATAQGAAGTDIDAIRSTVEEITGRGDKGGSKYLDRLGSALYVAGYITMLPRAAWTALTEPITIIMRTGDVRAAGRMFAYYAREMARGAKSTKDLARLAEMIGITSTPLHDTVMLNRMSGDFGNAVAGNTLMARFFRANLLSQITNAQRRAVLGAGFFWMKDMATVLADPNTDTTKRRILEAEFADLGIDKSQVAGLADWLASKDGMLSVDDLRTPQGQLAAEAAARLVDQTIQNPRRADKPMLASTALGRVAYALMSFLYTFYRNVHLATAHRAKRNYTIAREEGASKAGAVAEAAGPLITSFGGGFATMLLGQIVVTTAREAIFNREQWEEKDKEDERGTWLFNLALSRTGIFGPLDPIKSSLDGLRYERDLANLFIGAYPSFIVSSMQNIIKGMPTTEAWPGGPVVGARNSPNTNTAERTAAKSAYRLAAAPLLNVALSAMNTAGPLGAGVRYAALIYASSPHAATLFADATMGPE